MINLVILGAGNVATHLAKAFSNAENIKLIQVYNHRPEPLKPFKRFTKTTTEITKLAKADIYLMALKDDVIAEVAEMIPYKEVLVVHTSGSVALKTLKSFKNHGVFYPVQTFSKKKDVNFREIPICLEANSVENLEILKKLAENISNNIFEIDSEQRKALHLAAVYVNNFTNHLYSLGAEICRKNEIPFDILKPLIRETIDKLESLAPREAQTGPALRNDKQTIATHLAMLEPKQQELYNILTNSIRDFYGKEL
ncbi:Rossmann-like and DUF2520 domain-containing protein [Salegentibacter sp.]|uniref:Rossmann-like and DUF2520 domain-containing protein n=1 Tax=Salegentibacter sp. TaxID=1903072 RepID=UPI0035656E1F